MTSLNKVKGAKEVCPSCHKEMVCAEVTFKGETKLQWQDPTTNKAHYNYDFKTKTTSCNLNSAEVSEKVSAVKTRGEIHLKDLKTLTLEALASLKEETDKLLDAQLARIYYIEEGLRAKGLEPTGPFVGMLYNQQVETLRHSG